MKKIVSIVAVVVILASCNAGSASTAGAKGSVINDLSLNTETGNNLVYFKINGEAIKTSGWTISRFTFKDSKEWLNVTTNMNAEKKTINVNIYGTIPGTYDFGEGLGVQKKSHGSFYPDYMDDITNSYSFSSGSFIITSIDTVQRTLNADFFGIVKNGKGESFEITDGKIINGTLNIGVINY